MATRVLWLTKGLGPGGTERLLVELARATRSGPCASRRSPTSCRGRTTSPASWRRRASRPCACRRAAGTHAGRCGCASSWRTAGSTSSTATRRSLPSPHDWRSSAFPRSRRPALVTTEHNTWTSLRPATRWANRLTAGLDAATFAVTEESAASLRGAAAARAEVLVHGIDIERTAARPAGERAAVRRGARAARRRARDRHRRQLPGPEGLPQPARGVPAPRRSRRRVPPRRRRPGPAGGARSPTSVTSSGSATTWCSPGSDRTPSR